MIEDKKLLLVKLNKDYVLNLTDFCIEKKEKIIFDCYRFQTDLESIFQKENVFQEIDIDVIKKIKEQILINFATNVLKAYKNSENNTNKIWIDRMLKSYNLPFDIKYEISSKENEND